MLYSRQNSGVMGMQAAGSSSSAGALSTTEKAGFWIRFVAIFIDGIILFIPLFIIGFAIGLAIGFGSNGGNTASTTANPGLSALENALGLALQFGYFSYFWSTGATPGMRIFGLKVVDAQTLSTISFGKAALRFVGYYISALVCAIGLIWAAFDGRKQGWHDKIAGTLVIHTT